MSILAFIGIVAIIVAVWLIAGYNGFVTMRNRVNEAWADIDTQLKRRYDMIPNLVETVRGYMAHEKEVFEKVAQLRTQAMGAGSMDQKAQAEGQFSQALKSLFAVAENYPELKANQNFLELQRELVDTEDKIQAARRFYNGGVRDYNTAIEQFPGMMIARAFGFAPKEMFGTETEAEREPVKVSFK